MVIRQRRGKALAKTVLIGPLPPPVSGQSISFRLLVDGFRQRKLSFKVVNIGGAGFETFVGKFSVRRALQWCVLIIRFSVLAAGRPKAIYVTIAQSWVGFLRDFYIIWWSRLWRHRVVMHLHGGGFGKFFEELPAWKKWLVKNTWLQASEIIVLSENLREMFSFDSRFASKIAVVANALTEECGSLPSTGKTLPADKSAKILYLSNLIESKGYMLALEAIRVLKQERGRAVEADFCGEFVPESGGNFEQSVELKKKEFLNLIDQWGLKNSVRYRGPVGGEIKAEMFRESHFFLLPTQYPNEGQPVSIIEALANGLVVMATPVAAIPEMLENGVCGVLIPPRPEGIADRLEKLMDNDEEFFRISSAAVLKYRSCFTREAHLGALIPGILGTPDGLIHLEVNEGTV